MPTPGTYETECFLSVAKPKGRAIISLPGGGMPPPYKRPIQSFKINSLVGVDAHIDPYGSIAKEVFFWRTLP